MLAPNQSIRSTLKWPIAQPTRQRAVGGHETAATNADDDINDATKLSQLAPTVLVLKLRVTIPKNCPGVDVLSKSPVLVNA